MKIQITAVGLDMTPATTQYTTEKVQKLEKMIIPKHREGALADVKLTFAPSETTGTKDKCHITISNLGQKDVVNMEVEAADMHAAIDGCVNKLREPLRRHEERYRDHLRKESTEAKQNAALDPSLRAPEGDDAA